MPRYGRDFSRSRFEDDRWSDRGGRGDFGGMRSEGRGRFGRFNEDAVDEMSGFGPGGGAYDEEFEPGFRGGYGGHGMGGYRAGNWGFEGREDLGGYERGYGRGRSRGDWGGEQSGWEGGWGERGAWGRGRDLGGRGYDSFGEHRPGGLGGGLGTGRGGDELRRTRAADIMTEDPECVTPDVSLADAARRMRDLDVGIIPVVESDDNRRLRGVITDRDIAIRAVADGRDASSTRVGDVMTTDVETCNKNDPVQNVLRVMEREQVRRVPITDREGRLVGIIAQADVAMELNEEPSERRVADTLERISEPTGQQRRGGGMRAAQGRGTSTSRGRTSMGGMSARGELGEGSTEEGSSENR